MNVSVSDNQFAWRGVWKEKHKYLFNFINILHICIKSRYISSIIKFNTNILKEASRKWIVRFFQRILFCGLWMKYSSGTS